MSNKDILQSPDLNIDTLKCPKCNAIWRSEWYYDYDEGGLVHEEDLCPNGCCTKILKTRIKGNVIPRN